MLKSDKISEEGSPVLGKIPIMPPDDLMISEIAIMTGGRDQEGRPIITIPSRQFGILKHTALEEVIKYYIGITRPQIKHVGFGFVVDLSKANESVIDIIISTLNSVQAQMKGSVAMLYAVSPMIKDQRKHLLTRLGLRTSKKAKYKSISVPLFKSTAHYNLYDLYNNVDKSNLTQYLGGYLNYDHIPWIKFRKIFEPFYREAEELIKKIPPSFQQLTLLSDLPKGKTIEELQTQRAYLQQQYKDIKRELEIESLLSQCKGLRTKLKVPDDNPIFVAMAQTPMFKDTLYVVNKYYERLSGADQKSDVLYQKAEHRINQSLQHLLFESNLNQLIDWINDKGMTYLRINTEIPDCLSRAEMLKNHFETGFLTSAKEVIRHSNNLLQQADDMVIKDHYNIPVILSSSKNFTTLLQQFKNAVQRRHKVLHHVLLFYLIMQKCLHWYRKTLTFLPPQLLERKDFFVSASSSRKYAKHPYLLTMEWRKESTRFLSRHSPPSIDDLRRFKESILLISDMKIRTQARLLIHRCLLLRHLFNSNDVMTPKEILKILQWQTNYLEGYDDIELGDDSETSQDNDRYHARRRDKDDDNTGQGGGDHKKTDRRNDKSKYDDSGGGHDDRIDGKEDMYNNSHSDHHNSARNYSTSRNRKKKKVPTATLR